MLIKSQKDFFSGLMFTVVGAAFAYGATGYSVGTGGRMGPGYFPLLLGVILAILGGIIMFKALVVHTADGEPYVYDPAAYPHVGGRVSFRPVSAAFLWGPVRAEY